MGFYVGHEYIVSVSAGAFINPNTIWDYFSTLWASRSFTASLKERCFPAPGDPVQVVDRPDGVVENSHYMPKKSHSFKTLKDAFLFQVHGLLESSHLLNC